MRFDSPQYNTALADFRQARRQAAMQDILARFTGKPVQLLPFSDVYKKLRASGMADRGLKEIPIEAIVGSVNRYSDFTRSFLPRGDHDAQRWATVKTLTGEPAGLPPIQVYRIGDAYFVADGNHRVSVARQVGATTIEAYVTEVHTRVPLSASASPEELILKSEYADFLERTRLDTGRPGANFEVTVPGEYTVLEEQIETHRRGLAGERGEQLSPEDAACRWYDEVYQPVALTIRDRGILRDFPGRTETDLYVWVLEHGAELEAELGWQVRPEMAAASLAAQSSPGGLLGVFADGPATGQWRQARIEDRYTDRLFADILAPISGEEVGWHALTQAILVAKREGSQIHGLHVVSNEGQKETDDVHRMRELFAQRCEEAGVHGTLAVEAGEIAATICSRALLADLVILNLAYPPSPQPLARLGSGFRTIVRRCARPILAVPGTSTPLERVLLAYDGSPKAREALFVATYFAEQWRASLAVVTVIESEASRAALDDVREYVEMHEVDATLIEKEKGPTPGAILKAAEEQGSQLIVMGGYGSRPVIEVVVGSSVDQVLRESKVPMLICR